MVLENPQEVEGEAALEKPLELQEAKKALSAMESEKE